MTLSIADPCLIETDIVLNNCEYSTIYIGIFGINRIKLNNCREIELRFASYILKSSNDIDARMPIIDCTKTQNLTIIHEGLKNNEKYTHRLDLDDNVSKTNPEIDLNDLPNLPSWIAERIRED